MNVVWEIVTCYLFCIQSFYYEKKAIMSNEEFDNLKEELMWEGSSVVILSMSLPFLLQVSWLFQCFHCSFEFLFKEHTKIFLILSFTEHSFFIIIIGPDEQKLLEASMAYASGKPIMTDAEFDELKARLRVGFLNPF